MPTNAQLQKQIDDLQKMLTVTVTPELAPKMGRWCQVVYKDLSKRSGDRKPKELTVETGLLIGGKRVPPGGEFDVNKLGPNSGYKEGVDYTLIETEPKEKD